MKATLCLLLLGAAAVSAQFSDCRLIDPRVDTNRAVNPPTLINDNNDLDTTSAVVETGLRGTDLEIGFTLDDGIYSDGFNALVNGRLDPAADDFDGDNRYADPTFYFVAQAGNANGFAADDKLIGNEYSQCSFETDGVFVDSSTEDAAISINKADLMRPDESAYDAQDDCGANVALSGKVNFRRALRECGFTATTDTQLSVADFADNQAGNTPDNSYTRYLGVLKVETTRFGGLLRTNEVVLREEFGFQIVILFPETVNVSSANISVIGEVVEQAAVTHQIWNSNAATNFGDVDINILFGTTFPNAITTFPTDATINPTLTLIAEDTAACAGFTLLTASPCDVAGQTLDLYDQGILCDTDGSGDCSLGDFFQPTVVADDWATPSLEDPNDIIGGFGGFVDQADFDNFPLPATRCSQSNSGDQDADACLQNVWLTLRPIAGWCDLNVAVNMTLGVVCRDDANGDDATGADSFIPDGSGTTANGLLTPGGDALSCQSSSLPRREVWLAFELASDNFCPRVIATGSVTADMALFESIDGHATWGAHEIDTSTAWAATGDLSSTCDDSTTNNLCAQIPLLHPETATAVTGSRKLQSDYVFGTYVYGETRVVAEAGVNVADAELTTLYISSNSVDAPTVEDEDNSDATEDGWAKLLVSGSVVDTGDLISYKDASIVATNTRVELSQDITANSMLRTALANDIGDSSVAFFDTNSQTGVVGSASGRLNENFQGATRFRVLMDEFSIFIQDPAEEAPETITFYGDLAITYEAANTQGTQSVTGRVPSTNANRARLLAAPAFTGSTATNSASISPSNSAGATSTGSSGLVSAMLVGAAVFGVVAVGAAAGFFVVRKRKTAARSAKKSSSSMEMNDTAQVQV